MTMLARSAWLFLCYGAFRWARVAVGGRVLVRGLRASNRTVSTVAATLLARSGRRASGLLQDAIAHRHELPTVLILAGDTGDQRFEAPLRALADDADANIARAAAEGLRLLEAHRGGG